MASQLSDNPHHLFMLNKQGQTPLDITIQEGVDAAKREAEWRKLGPHKNAEAEMEDKKEHHARDKSLILV